MSKQNDIAAAIAARLESVRVASGYTHDAGARVYRGRRALNPNLLPAIVLHELEDEVVDQKSAHASASASGRLPFVIQVTARLDSEDHPNIVAHELVADIKRCLFSGDPTWGGLAESTQYTGRTLGEREDGTNVVTATVQIRVGFVEDLANP